MLSRIKTRRRLIAQVTHAQASARNWRQMYEQQSALVDRAQTAAEALVDISHEIADRRDVLAAERARICAVLSEVAVYEGMDVTDNLVTYISEVVRDHEELEARIDYAMMIIAGVTPTSVITEKMTPVAVLRSIADALRGGERFEDAG